MSKFSKGDIVDVPWGDEAPHRGVVHESWGKNISRHTGLPMVEIFLFDEGFVGHFDEDEVELALDEYEFAAVRVDLEDFEQDFLGGGYYERECWGTLEEAEKLIKDALVDKHHDDWKEDTQLQINRRRKAGHTVGYKAYRWGPVDKD